MLANPAEKYRPFQGIQLTDRQWPSRTITQPPIWMSTDLRDGNQALINPMSIETKMRFFKALVAMGFKEIEVGFPSASDIDFQFVRQLIEHGHIPEDVTIEVLTQARKELIEKTIDSLQGAKRAILHVYNPLAPEFRRIVYNTDKAGAKAIAVQATQWSKELTAQHPETEWVYQYSPETFSSTEVEFAKEVCDAVIDVWQPTPEHKMIINLPATVEMSTPNTFADQVEWMHRNINKRDSVIISVHPHNDRGTAVAAAELAVMAGADRVEGCLFGNGERTGNVDLVTLALNLYSQGVHPNLDFSNIDQVRRLVEECNQIPVHPRHPYVGELVYTAFSGSHQDAIKKGFAQQQAGAIWEVPYLPIDPADLNRSYDAVVRVNAQSGKGGVSYLLQAETGLELPRRLQIEFSRIVQAVSDATGKEVTGHEVAKLFGQEYFDAVTPFEFTSCSYLQKHSEQMEVSIEIYDNQKQEIISLHGTGNGPIDATVNAINAFTSYNVELVDYHEHGIGEGSDATAVTYVDVKINGSSATFGVGKDANIIHSAIKALVNGINRFQTSQEKVESHKATAEA